MSKRFSVLFWVTLLVCGISASIFLVYCIYKIDDDKLRAVLAIFAMSFMYDWFIGSKGILKKDMLPWKK